MAPFDSGLARKAAQRSAEVRREKAKLRRPLVLPSFTSVENVMAALELGARAGALGTLASGQLAAVTKACEVWLKCESHVLDLKRVKAMEARIVELEAALAAAVRERQRGEPWQEAS
jgi:hypothetical protein